MVSQFLKIWQSKVKQELQQTHINKMKWVGIVVSILVGTLSWIRVSWSSSVPSGKFWKRTLIRPCPLFPNPFQVKIHSMLYRLTTKSLINQSNGSFLCSYLSHSGTLNSPRHLNLSLRVEFYIFCSLFKCNISITCHYKIMEQKASEISIIRLHIPVFSFLQPFNIKVYIYFFKNSVLLAFFWKNPPLSPLTFISV
jgi:hypothetical protein